MSEKRSTNELYLLASLDGINESGDLIFEHKLWNATLAENIKNGILEPEYYWQLEHQMLVCEADKAIFVCSDGTAEKWAEMYYESVPDRRRDIIQGWKQFAVDLAAHKIAPKQELVVPNATALPVLECRVEGSQIITNLDICLSTVKELAATEISRKLETDQDFADKEALNKSVKDVRAQLKARIADVRSEFVSFAEFEVLAKELDSVLQKMQSDGERKVKEEKSARKLEITNKASRQILDALAEASERIPKITCGIILAQQIIDWTQITKGLRTTESIQSAVDNVVADEKIRITRILDAVKPNYDYLLDFQDEYGFLFDDVENIINQPAESFQALVQARISGHKKLIDELAEKRAAQIENERQAKLEASLTKPTIEKPASIQATNPISVAEEVIRPSQRLVTMRFTPLRTWPTDDERQNPLVKRLCEQIEQAESYIRFLESERNSKPMAARN